MNVKNTLVIVVPCYNESEIFLHSLGELKKILNSLVEKNKINEKSYIFFVDDGSKDNTWELIKKENLKSSNVKGLKLSCNRGHQIAILAGMSNIDADFIITIDADLQDDINVIEKMIDEFYLGNEIVYGVREQRDTDTFFKRTTAQCFYKLLSFIGVNQINNHADFRLLSRRALQCLLQYTEQNIYIRGLIPLMGFKSSQVKYKRLSRLEGKTKYSLKKMLGLAINGITSFSVAPLRIVFFMGFFISIFSFIFIIYILILYFQGKTIHGWSSIVISIFFLGGLQIVSIGIIGEYIGKIYFETKKRPKYFIEEKID